MLEDFQPVGAHLDWRLSEHYWATRGVLAFAENRVPHLINNSGQLSTRIARVVLAACEETPPEARWSIIELGAGSALFAKLFLDTSRRLAVARKMWESRWTNPVGETSFGSTRGRAQWNCLATKLT